MNVAITGHTKGIGLAFYNYFLEKEYTCYGFSRSNGYDISNVEDRNKILSNILDFDIFVNNAYNNFDDSQLNILKLVYENWKNKDKIIINISSRVTDFENTDDMLKIYAKTKQDLDLFCKGKINSPWILNLKPGLTDTQRVRTVQDKPRIDVEHVIKVADFALLNKDIFKVTSLTFGL